MKIPNLLIFERSLANTHRYAVSNHEKLYSFANILSSGLRISQTLKPACRIGLLCPPGVTFVKALYGIWMSKSCVVPLSTSARVDELQYTLTNSEASTVLYHLSYTTIMQELGKRLPNVEWKLLSDGPALEIDVGSIEFEHIDKKEDAIMIYTSGTTSRPKGVRLSYANIEAQVSSMQVAWEWSEKDSLINVLPLHHIHGLVNIVITALHTGACLEFIDRFSAKETWTRFVKGGLTLFMAVPTIYIKLIEEYKSSTPEQQEAYRNACQSFRLMVSGSSALPKRVFEEWETISECRLLERYGMTEIGMALTNPLHGKRIPGTVGKPFSSIETRVNDAGELFIRGPGISTRGYWMNELETRKSWDADGWFATGDIVSVENGIFKILGRASVDIIKSRAYKISALEIEGVILDHPDVFECAVMGIPDDVFGEAIAALVVLKNKHDGFDMVLETFCHERMARYKCPSVIRMVDEIPKNAMGKVDKKSLKFLFE